MGRVSQPHPLFLISPDAHAPQPRPILRAAIRHAHPADRHPRVDAAEPCADREDQKHPVTKVLRRMAVSALTTCLALSSPRVAMHGGDTVPKAACGGALDKRALEPLLVDGKELEVVGDSRIDTRGKSRRRCEISVGDWPAVGLEVKKIDKVYDPMGNLDSFRFENREEIEDPPGPRRRRVSRPSCARLASASGCWSWRARFCGGLRRICRRRTHRQNNVPARPRAGRRRCPWPDAGGGDVPGARAGPPALLPVAGLTGHRF